jgi:ATP-binding cassette, subfamily B, bacterial CvaB/MchF/RaxB
VSVASLLNFRSRGHLPVVHQTEAAECGLACLAMVASYHGHRIDLNTLRRRYPVSLKGVTLRGLMQVASQMPLLAELFGSSLRISDSCIFRLSSTGI